MALFPFCVVDWLFAILLYLFGVFDFGGLLLVVWCLFGYEFRVYGYVGDCFLGVLLSLWLVIVGCKLVCMLLIAVDIVLVVCLWQFKFVWWFSWWGFLVYWWFGCMFDFCLCVYVLRLFCCCEFVVIVNLVVVWVF